MDEGITIAKRVEESVAKLETPARKRKKQESERGKDVKAAMTKGLAESAAMAKELALKPERLREVNSEGKRLYMEKAEGPFTIPFQVMKRGEGNVLRAMQERNIEVLRERIQDTWYDGSPMVGCVTKHEFKKIQRWLNKRESMDEKLPDKLKGLVTVLDGQHRIEVLRRMLQDAQEREDEEEAREIENCKISLTLYVDVNEEEQKVITWFTQILFQNAVPITLVDLLRQMRESWLDLICCEKPPAPITVDKELMLNYNHQLYNLICKVSVEEVQREATEQAQQKEVRAKNEERARQKLVAKAMTNYSTSLYKQVKWAFQVPLFKPESKWNVWPLWYWHLKKMEEHKGNAYTLEAYSELANMFATERFAVMAYAATNGTSGSDFKPLCKFVKAYRSVLIKYHEEFHSQVKIAVDGDKGKLLRANTWLQWMQETRLPSVLSISTKVAKKFDPIDFSNFFRRMMSYINEPEGLTVDVINHLAPLGGIDMPKEEKDFIFDYWLDSTFATLEAHWKEDIVYTRVEPQITVSCYNFLFLNYITLSRGQSGLGLRYPVPRSIGGKPGLPRSVANRGQAWATPFRGQSGPSLGYPVPRSIGAKPWVYPVPGPIGASLGHPVPRSIGGSPGSTPFRGQLGSGLGYPVPRSIGGSPMAIPFRGQSGWIPCTPLSRHRSHFANTLYM